MTSSRMTPTPARPAAPGGSPREQAYAALKAALLRGDCKPGQMLSLRELATRFGCPMAAVRDAVVRLECERLLRVHPQRGIQVVEVDLDFVREAFQLRRLLELEGLRRWMDDADGAAIEHVQQETARSVDELGSKTSPAALERATQADWALHAMIVGALRSTLLSDIYRQNRERQRLIGRTYQLHPGSVMRAALVEHLAVLEAMASGDCTRAAEALEAHLASAMRRQIGV
jgi:DNA-binding GntR family transcriptional regulator